MNHGITTEDVTINAELARSYLQDNVNNRNLSRRTVQRYLTDMLQGNWIYTGDPIRFSKSGKLLDGQHRLAALAQLPEDHPGIEFPIMRGFDDEVQLAMDQGRKRTTGDQMKLAGYKSANRLAASIKLYLSWQHGSLFSLSATNMEAPAQITTAVVLEWAEKNGELLDTVYGESYTTRYVLSEPRVWLAFLMRALEVDDNAAMTFKDHLVSLANLPQNSPILTLHRRFANIRADREMVPTRDQLALFIQAWNYWLQGRTVAQLPRPRGGAWTAANFPVMLDPAEVPGQTVVPTDRAEDED